MYLERHETKMICNLFDPIPVSLIFSISNPKQKTVPLTDLSSDLKTFFSAVGPDATKPISSSVLNQSVMNHEFTLLPYTYTISYISINLYFHHHLQLPPGMSCDITFYMVVIIYLHTCKV